MMIKVIGLTFVVLAFSSCVSGRNAQIPEDIYIKSNRQELGVSVVKVTAESEAEMSNRAWHKETTDTYYGYHGRYVGYDLEVDRRRSQSGEAFSVVKKGSYESKAGKTFTVRFLGLPHYIGDRPIQHCGQPGVVCAILESRGENQEFTTPPRLETFEDKNGIKYQALVKGQKYDAGSLGGLMVDFPFDDFQRVLRDGVEIKGRIRFFRRGGHHREVYDVCNPQQDFCYFDAYRDFHRNTSGLSLNDPVYISWKKIIDVIQDIRDGKLAPEVIIKRSSNFSKNRLEVEFLFVEL